jgi:hypothetical protein
MFAEHTAPFIRTPVFALQSQYDEFQMVDVLRNASVKSVNELGANITSRLDFGSPGCQRHSHATLFILLVIIHQPLRRLSSTIRAENQALNENIDKVMILLDLFTWLGRPSAFLC